MKQRGFLTYNSDGNIRTPAERPSDQRTTVFTIKSAAPLGLCAIVIGLAVVSEPAPASADVCGSVGGRRVSVSGCGSIADAVAPWVPPPGYYAPLPEDYAAPPPPPPPPPNVNVCANFGRRISVSGCV
jgi:hypothetical protein